jgi:hypothetical protein
MIKILKFREKVMNVLLTDFQLNDFEEISLISTRLCHPPDGSTSPKYKLLFYTTIINFTTYRMH